MLGGSLMIAAVAVVTTLVAAAQRTPTGRAQPRVPQAASATLVQSAYLSYAGAFRLPNNSSPTDAGTFNGGGEALTYDAASQTLLLAGSRCCAPATVAELTIPEIRQAASVNELAMAVYRQPHTDILRGKYGDVGCGGPLGGLLPWSNGLVATVYCYYDAGYVQTKSHYLTGRDFARLPAVIGPVEVSTGTSEGGRAGFVSAYMARVPPEWQGVLGPAFTGNCCIPIITRTSWGPGLSVFDPTDIGVKNPVPATTLIRYTAENPTLGRCDSDGDRPNIQFNCTTSMAGVVFPRGTASVLFFGSHGTGKHCYGATTPDASKHNTPNPQVPGESICYDPARGDKGPHAYPYVSKVWAYSATDLVAVKNRQKQPWQIVPYATWTFETPFGVPSHVPTGVAYDEVNQRIFVAMSGQDGPRPLVHVFDLKLAALATGG